MDEIHYEIEKYWREKFSQEIQECIMGLEDDDTTKWFNEGLRYASMYIRHKFDEPLDSDGL